MLHKKFLRALLAAITIAGLCQCSTAPTPPDFSRLPVSNNPQLAAAGLIGIKQVDRYIAHDLQYTRPTRSVKTPLYSKGFPTLLRPETALRLKHANQIVREHGLRILVWDAYRPPSAQWKLYIASGRNDKFVANPGNSPSQHSCGTAVDITLVTRTGLPIPMPTEFDSFSNQAASNFPHTNQEIHKNLKILQSAMKQAGFYSLPAEWWHYIDKNYKNYPDTVPLSSLLQ